MIDFRGILDGNYSDEDVIKFINGLRERGESVGDIVALVNELEKDTLQLPKYEGVLDVCGTGGSGFDRFNVSTASTFILSGLGVKTLKHGNKGSLKPNGSFDLLEGLGVNVTNSPKKIDETFSKTNLGFLFARYFHPTMKNVINARRKAGGRSIFNLAGPLANPSRIDYQVIGTADQTKMQVLAEACQKLGRKKFAIVFGEPKIDEVSISGKSTLLIGDQKNIEIVSVKPSDFGIEEIRYENIPCGEVETNKKIFLQLIENCSHRAIKQMVALNSGLALFVAGRSTSIYDGFEQSIQFIENGGMKKQYEFFLKEHI